jgi:type II secretory pathway pseudopilin PulG
MATIVRRNAVIFNATFTASDGSATQPTTVKVNLNYPNSAGVTTVANFALTYSSTTGAWSGAWDSSVASAGTVNWVIYGTGALEASTQGQFQLVANSANNI